MGDAIAVPAVLDVMESLPVDRVSWLLWNDGTSAKPIVDESLCMVVEVDGYFQGAHSTTLEHVLRPALAWPVDRDGSRGEGWVMDAPAHSDYRVENLRQMRYAVSREQSGAVVTWMAVRCLDDSVTLAKFAVVNEGRAFVCTAQAMARTGQRIEEPQVHLFARCCKYCGMPVLDCSCGLATRFSAGTGKPTGFLLGDEAVGVWGLQRSVGSGAPVAVTIRHTQELSQVRRFQDFVLQHELSSSMADNVDLDFFDWSIGAPSAPNAMTGSEYSNASSGAVSAPSHGTAPSQVTAPSHSHGATPRKMYPCEICGRIFNQSGHRNEHRRRIHYNKGYKCTLCDHTFGVPSKLRRHVRAVHQNLRNHACPICDKRFKEKSHLTQHLTSHGKTRRRRQLDTKLHETPAYAMSEI